MFNFLRLSRFQLKDLRKRNSLLQVDRSIAGCYTYSYVRACIVSTRSNECCSINHRATTETARVVHNSEACMGEGWDEVQLFTTVPIPCVVRLHFGGLRALITILLMKLTCKGEKYT